MYIETFTFYEDKGKVNVEFLSNTILFL